MYPSGLVLCLALAFPARGQEAPVVAPDAPMVRATALAERMVWEQRSVRGRRVAGVAVQPIPGGAWIAVDEGGGVWLSEDEGQSWDNVVRPEGGLDEDALPDDEQLLLEAEARRDELLDAADDEVLQDAATEPADALDAEVEAPEPTDAEAVSAEDAVEAAADLVSARAEIARALPVVWVDPADPERAHMARADGLWLSTSSGRTWERVDVADGSDPAVTLFARAPDGALLLGTTDGVRYSTDEGSTWIDVEDATDGSVVAGVVVHDGWTWAATDRGLFRSPNGLVWERVVLPGSEPVRVVVPDPMWERGFWVATNAALYRTDDGGASFYVSGRQPLRGLRALVHLDEPGHLLATSDDGVWESMDGGVAWTTADRRLSEPDVRALAFGESGPVIATPGGVWRLVSPRDVSAVVRAGAVLPLADAIGAATHRDALDIDLLSLARIGVASRFVPSFELRFDWGSAARRLVDYADSDTVDAFDDDWAAYAKLCWGGCSTTIVPSYSGDTDVADPVGGDFAVVNGRVYGEGEPVAAAANVAQSIRSYRRYLADHVADAWLARARAMSEASAMSALPLRDQVFHALQIQELDARLDALTDGAFSRPPASSKESP